MQVTQGYRIVVDLFSLALPSIKRPLPTGKALNHRRQYIAAGDKGTAQTIAAMRDLVTQGKRDERVRRDYSIPIISGKLYPYRDCEPKNYWCYCENIFLYCRDKIKYVHDPNGVELVEDAYTVLTRGAADCDSNCILFASMCESIGRECRFVTIRPEKGGNYFHVFCEVNIPGKGWVTADPTMQGKPFGWRPDSKYPATTWPASNDASELDRSDIGNFPCMESTDLSGLDGAPDLDDPDFVNCMSSARARGATYGSNEMDACYAALDAKQRAWHEANANAPYTSSDVFNPNTMFDPNIRANQNSFDWKWLAFGAAGLAILFLAPRVR